MAASLKNLIVVAGPNGVGKTTFAEEYVAINGHAYLSADAIATKLCPQNPASAQVAAGREFLKQSANALTANKSLVVESTLAGRGFEQFLRKARAAGFVISIAYLFLDSADTCVRRVNERVQKGGHFVPEPDIRRRFARSICNFWHRYRSLADSWLLVYNSGSQPQDVASGSRDRLSVADAELYAQFHRLLEAHPNG